MLAFEILKLVSTWAREQSTREANGPHYRAALLALADAADNVKTFH